MAGFVENTELTYVLLPTENPYLQVRSCIQHCRPRLIWKFCWCNSTTLRISNLKPPLARSLFLLSSLGRFCGPNPSDHPTREFINFIVVLEHRPMSIIFRERNHDIIAHSLTCEHLLVYEIFYLETGSINVDE